MNNNTMFVRKELRTGEQIAAAYPEHDKLRAANAEYKAIERFVTALYEHKLYVCEHNPDGRYYPVDSYRDWRPQIFAALGVDWDAFWREKDDMLAQIRVAQGANPDGSMPHE